VSLEAVLLGIGAIISAAGGCALVIREFRRRDRRGMQRLLDDTSDELVVTHQRLVGYRRWGFNLSERLAAHGETAPPPPDAEDGL